MVKDDALRRVRDGLADTVDKLVLASNTAAECPFLVGRNLGTVTLSTTPLAIEHGLGKLPTGYLILSQSANTVIYEPPSTRTARVLYLQAGAAVAATVWVF